MLVLTAKALVDFLTNFLQVGLLLCLCGGALLAGRHIAIRHRVAAVASPMPRLLGVGLLGLVVGVLFIVGGAMRPPIILALQHWESRYPPFNKHLSCAMLDRAEHRWVVVLGSAASGVQSRSAIVRLREQGLSRLTQGISVYRQCEAQTLGFSGDSSAKVSALAARELGVPSGATRILHGARTTAEEALLWAPLLGGEPFILVSSAWHLPRAMALFEAQGMAPVAAPTDFITGTKPVSSSPLSLLLLHPQNYELWILYLHERIGLLWAHFNGDLQTAY